MEEIQTNSYFVTIYKSKNKMFFQRRKRKGLYAIIRILTLKEINKYLSDTEIKYPKLLNNGLDLRYIEKILKEIR